MDTLEVFEITKNEDNLDEVRVIKKEGSLENILEEYLGIDITLIPCAGGDKIASEREQWNDGTNTLCIAPEVLREKGIKVIEMNSAELSRGRGGPRCMSMPLERED